MTDKFTQTQAARLAIFIHALRDDWNEQGILTALKDLRDKPLASVTAAAVAAAQNPNNRTPAVIGMDGAHWNDAPTTGAPSARGPLCDTCTKPEAVCQGAAGNKGRWRDHEFITVADADAQRANRSDRRAIESGS